MAESLRLIFRPKHSENLAKLHFCVHMNTEQYFSKSVWRNDQQFRIMNELFEVVPFSKYALWKHKVEKTATLWV